jgi:hypothetical protein
VADSSFQYDSYCIPLSSSGLAAGTTTPASTDQTGAAAFNATTSNMWIRSTLQKRVQAEATLTGHRQELHDYLDSPLVDPNAETLDVVAWWGVSRVAIALAFTDANPYLSSETRPLLSNSRPCGSRLPYRSRFGRQV